jgi:hypothetical protein
MTYSIPLEECVGLQAFNRFLKTLMPKNGSKRIWLKQGNEHIFYGEWDISGSFLLTDTRKLEKSDATSRVSGKVYSDAYRHLRSLSENNDGGVFYIPTQPQQHPLAQCVDSTDDLASELDFGTFEEQHERYSEFVFVTGLNFASLLTSGSVSIHGHTKLDKHYPVDEIIYFRYLWAIALMSDPVAVRLHQPMRIPGFFRKEKEREQTLLSVSSDRYTLEQIREGLKKWFKYRNFVFPEDICKDFWMKLQRVLATENTQPYDQKVESIRTLLAQGNDHFVNAAKKRKQYLAENKIELTDEFYDSVFGQAIAKLEKINLEATPDSYIALDSSLDDSLDWDRDDHARCGCSFHDSKSGNSAWLEQDDTKDDKWLFRCQACTNNYPIEYSDFWRAAQQGKITEKPKGKAWFDFVKNFLVAHDQDVSFLEVKKSYISDYLRDRYFSYFENCPTVQQALTGIVQIVQYDIVVDEKTKLLNELIFFICLHFKDDRFARRDLFNFLIKSLALPVKEFNDTVKEQEVKVKLYLKKDQEREQIVQAVTKETPDHFLYMNGDHLVNVKAVQNLNPFSYKAMSNSRFDLKCNLGLLVKSFFNYYGDRIKIENIGENSCDVWMYNHTAVDGKSLYYWVKLDKLLLISKLNMFTEFHYDPTNRKSLPYSDNDFSLWSQENTRSLYTYISSHCCNYPKTVFKKDGRYIGFTNGLFDTKTKQLTDYHPSKKNFLFYPFDWESTGFESAEMTVKDYLRAYFVPYQDESWNESRVDYIFKLLALALTFNGSLTKKILWFHGKTNSGKSFFVETFSQLMNFRDLWQEVDNTLFAKNTFSYYGKPTYRKLLDPDNKFIGSYYENKAILFCDEVNSFLNAGHINTLKERSGTSDLMQIERKGKDYSECYVDALHILACEGLPLYDHKDGGMTSRIIRVPVQAVEHKWDEWQEAIDNQDFKRQFTLAIVNSDFYSVTKIKDSDCPWLETDRVRLAVSNDPVTQFLNDCFDITNDNDDFTASSILSQLYTMHQACPYSKINHDKMVKDIAGRLKTMNYQGENKKVRINANTPRGFTGLRLKPFNELKLYLNYMAPNFDMFHQSFIMNLSNFTKYSTIVPDCDMLTYSPA